MNRRRFQRLVAQALEQLPEPFARHLENVSLEVVDWPDSALREEMALEGDDTLFGLYLGLPLTEPGRDDLPRPPDRILLFQRPIEAACRTEADVVAEVRITLLHEVGHHFGLSDEELERYEATR